ncbi:uncharacterized protein LOC127100401 [Lathyrus oleraceus]|uniref:uncharacterized protein LOC127100401 n=1 Tax=Pisum sativum TaxID=3888 RepID=UPI0021D14FA9|nr:uncharacterized protein LOC127100401 [Pisum sativum]
MTWVSLINFEHKVFAEFKKFRIKSENHSGQKLKIFRTDGRGEYNSTEFRKFCEENGIEHEVTTSYIPQHDGLAERRNRTLLDLIRSMVKEKKLPHTLWGEVVATTAYVLNGCPTKKLKEIVPLDKWTRDKQESEGSKDDSETEDDSDGNSDSEDESDSEGEYDSDPDSDGDSNSGGNPDSRNILDSEGGHTSEGGTYGVLASDIVLASEEDSEQVQRPQRIINIPRRFIELGMLQDTIIDSEREVIQCSILVDSELVSIEEMLKKKVWLKAMK